MNKYDLNMKDICFAYLQTRHGAFACALLKILAASCPSGLSLTNAKTMGMNSVRLRQRGK